MASTSFRSAAVVCGVLTASLGFGLLTPAVATAATTTPAAASSSDSTVQEDNPDFDAIPVDPALTAPKFYQDWSTPFGSRIVAGDAGGDDVWLVSGNTVYDRSTGGGLFFLNVQNRHQDAGLEAIRVHTAADGTQTRGERVPMPRSIRVDGLQEQNTFTPGTTHFAGSATAGATIVAKDTASGDTLFTAKASGSRAGTGTWSADADLADADHVITLTQTTPDGRTNELRDVRFAPAASDAPAAPTLETTERRLDGSFVLTGEYADSADSVVVQDASGATIADATLAQTGYVAQIPQERIGSTVYVVAKAADGTPSSRTAATLAQLPTDASVPKPTLRSVFVHADGRVQVVGEPDGAPGLWILDGDRVIDGIAHNDLWSYVIRAQETGKQLEIANLGFDGQGFSSLSERVALPRLLQVDGITDENTYTPGAHAFEGTAEAGATITATDQRGRELFTTPVTGARSGVGTWKASADLTSTAGYDLTFTQTTVDGRTSVMRNIAFTSEDDSVAPIVVETPAMNGTATGPRPTFTGTGQAGSTIEIRGTTRVVTTAKVESDGTWSAASNIDLARGSYALTAKQTAPGNATTEAPVHFTIAAAAAAPIEVTSPEMNGTTTGARPTFTGTGQAGATIEIRGTTRVVTTAKVESNGTWSAASNIDLARGSYALTAKQTAPGNATTEAPVRFTIN
ncbi:Ig-like domain-containing protein [Curtobacterium flaccumfaciens]|uniref:Ig-like domain-containing protein n=1 Tax=Curtobacterium flaccumfaciens TaxID=2035 RepID=UPI00220C9F6C|nr:Ig-like domain-containing protein [Curtobacterium flaccumfaciens]UWD79713.1 Ig-like domain-containing protein [Curtobacterium flaccumfaciens]